MSLDVIGETAKSHGRKRHFRESVGRRGEEIGRRLWSDRELETLTMS